MTRTFSAGVAADIERITDDAARSDVYRASVSCREEAGHKLEPARDIYREMGMTLYLGQAQQALAKLP